MEELDARIGQNVQQLRGDLSQTKLAERMREYGHKWTQPTVVAVEKGERPLRLAEAAALGRILGRSIPDLIEEEHAVAAYALAERISRLRNSALVLFEEDEQLRLELAVLLDSIPPERMDGRLRAIGESWIDAPIEDVVREFRKYQAAEGARETYLSGTSDERMDEIKKQQAGSWLGRLHDAEVMNAYGERQAEA